MVQSAPQDLKPLTALRFAAALWVVGYDYWPNLAGASEPVFLTRGYLGVEMFFVLSGFILSHVYLQAAGEGRFRYGAFLWARIARVYPMHLATLAVIGLLSLAAAAAGVGMDHNLADWAALPANLTLTHAWGFAPAAAWNHPSWSVSAEWLAYLSFPGFAWAAWRLRDRPNLAVTLAILALFATYGAFSALAGAPLTSATFRWGGLRILPCFAYGCSIHLLWRSGAMGRRIQALFWTGMFACLALALAQIQAPDAALVTVFGGLILALAGLSSTGSRLLSGGVGVYLGEISYALYMVCFPWQLVFVNAAQRLLHLGEARLPLAVWLGLILGVVPLAALSHHLIERPCRRLLRRWADQGFPGLRLKLSATRPA